MKNGVEREMNVVEHEGVYKASRIAGPKHNYLGISFSEEDNDVRMISRKVESDVGEANDVSADDVRKIVKETVQREVKLVERQLYVSCIEYIPTDTPDAQAYEELAAAIVRYALQKLDRVGC